MTLPDTPFAEPGRASALAGVLQRHPRGAAALALGVVAAAVAARTWQPVADLEGAVPAIALGAGLSHAFAGAALGRRLLDRARTRSAAEALLLGCTASLVAVLGFAPAFAWWVGHGSARAPGGAHFGSLLVTIGFFSLFAGGWLLPLAAALTAAALWAAAGDRVSERP